MIHEGQPAERVVAEQAQALAAAEFVHLLVKCHDIRFPEPFMRCVPLSAGEETTSGQQVWRDPHHEDSGSLCPWARAGMITGACVFRLLERRYPAQQHAPTGLGNLVYLVHLESDLAFPHVSRHRTRWRCAEEDRFLVEHIIHREDHRSVVIAIRDPAYHLFG